MDQHFLHTIDSSMESSCSASISAGNCPNTAKTARISSTAVEARKLTEPMILPDRMASNGLSRWVALATQRRRCMFMITDSEGRRFSISGTTIL